MHHKDEIGLELASAALKNDPQRVLLAFDESIRFLPPQDSIAKAV